MEKNLQCLAFLVPGSYQQTFWHFLACRCITSVSASILFLFLSKFPTFLRTSIIGLQPILIQHDFILIWLYAQRSYFQIRSQSQVSVIRTWTYLSGGHSSTPNSDYKSLNECRSTRASPIKLYVLYYWNRSNSSYAFLLNFHLSKAPSPISHWTSNSFLFHGM